MIREHVEREKLLRERLEQCQARNEEQRRLHRLEVGKLEDLLNAQRVVIERLMAEKAQS
jgi:hypothetical protein